MSDVSVVGLGAMGSALARALLRGGHRVTVWNRTAARFGPLFCYGATAAGDLASALGASPTVLVCVDNYEVARTLLAGDAVRHRLAGRTLVQLSTGTPQEARDSERWAREAGADYLDGAILAYPDQMGTQDAAIFMAGAEPTFRRCEPLLRSLAGGLTHVGEQVGAASALDCAALSFLFGGLLGAIHGARVCEVEGLRADEFGSMLAELVPVLGQEVRQLGERIQASRFDGTQAALRTYAAAATRLVHQARDGRIPGDFPRHASEAFDRGMRAGLGDADLASLIEVLRQAP